MSQTVVWCTGISGAGRTAYLQEAQAFCESLGHTCRVLDVGHLLDEAVEEFQIGETATDLLDGNDTVLHLHRASALRSLDRQIEDATEEIVLVSTHACFMRKSRLMLGFDMNMIKRRFASRIDVFATIIHDCHDTWIELQSRPEWRDHLNLAEVAIWRDFETTLTKMLADYEAKPFYLLARNDPAEGLARLASASPAPSIYLSYPITAIMNENPQLLDVAKSLADRLRQAGFVVFNPLSIKDLPGTRTAVGGETTVEPEMESAARPYLESQVVSRDLQLIDQADVVVVYYPTDKVSPGVFTEMSRARDTGKRLSIFVLF